MTNVSPSAARQREVERAAAQSKVAAPASAWTAGRITALVIGSLLVLLSLGLLGTGGTALWADRTQREAGYVTTDVHHFSTSGAALATVSSELGSAGWGWLYPPSVWERSGSGSRLLAPIGRCSWGSARPRPWIATSPE
jgi:hypothetical protein